MSYSILQGDAFEILKGLPDNSMDAMLTDPPYGISFMSRKWDSQVPPAELWAEALRVLKPGAYGLVFGGTRTYHRLAVALEDAGFILKDTLMYLYGSGFPKSQDISKAIDKENGKHERDLEAFGSYVKACRVGKGYSLRELDGLMGTSTAASWWEGRKSGVLPPSLETYRRLKIFLSMDNRFDELIEWLEAEREIVGERRQRANSSNSLVPMNASAGEVEHITTPATPEAQRWQGYGSALKPAYEPILLVRKPVEKGMTNASSAVKYGAGALNIDGSRIESSETLARPFNEANNVTFGKYARFGNPVEPIGRFPANLLLDESAAQLLDASVGPRKSGSRKAGVRKGLGYHGADGDGGPAIESSEGNVSRFFYTSKSSRSERDAGLEGEPEHVQRYVNNRRCKACGKQQISRSPCECAEPEWEVTRTARVGRNTHPTVKPLDLCRYLATLLLVPTRDTPRKLLTPFSGSGSEMIGALLAGWDDVTGLEMEPEYIAIAEARIKYWTRVPEPIPQPQASLFESAAD